ncbi:MAG: penicillin-binding protein 1A, partial [Alphaproteobacteria bacterium]|nr:penicillin-binding protein 1A [Alphaproteobacteria bacterium]
VKNVLRFGSNRRPVGASTITQQVAKNFLLTNEVSIERKIKEMILAFRIEQAFTKDEILELYLNEIYLGARSYGVASASINYFDKALEDLTVGEAAYLAGLPKAPNNYHPVRRPDAAKGRRNYVLRRLTEDGYIHPDTAAREAAAEINVDGLNVAGYIEAPYFAEEIRREIVNRYGEASLYEGGLSVRSTLDPRLEAIAVTVLRDGLEVYDRRHGWRGPVTRFDNFDDWAVRLAETEVPPGAGDWDMAVVHAVYVETAKVGFADGTAGEIPFAELRWARKWLPDQLLGPEIFRVGDVLEVGDVVLVEALTQDEDGAPYPPSIYALRQIPDIQGAIVALDPHTGRVLAMVGGYDPAISVFNRATQAWRQPGSAFKPFVYMAALDSGFTPTTRVMDAPIVIDQGPELGKWKPENYSNRFYGPIPMRVGIEKSRNLMTVRLAQAIGMERVAEYAEAFGVVDELPPVLSMAIGAGETTLIRLTAGYAMIVNGGHRIEPTLVDRIQDRTGRSVFRHDTRPCDVCLGVEWSGQEPPVLPDIRERVVGEPTAYQMVSMLQGVVQRGTGRRVSSIGHPIAGKTGTTNNSMDAWFIGFTPDLAVGVFVGFDAPRTLGRRETGSSAAAPIFRDFMIAALANQSVSPFRIPEGIRLIRVDGDTGLLADASSQRVILEAFKEGTGPTGNDPVIGGGTRPLGALSGTSIGGIY